METAPSSKLKLIIPLVILLVAAAFAGWYWYVDLSHYITTDDASIDGNRVSVSPKMLGRIQTLTVDEGDTVKAGQLLVQLDDSDLQAQSTQSKSATFSAQQNVNLAKVTLSKAQDDFHRSETLYQNGLISKQDYDHALNTLQAAQAQYDISTAQVGTSQSQIGVVNSQLQNTKIVAPISGVIAKRWMLQGDVAQPGQPIFAIFDLDHLWITAHFEETKLSEIKVGEPVEITVDAFKDRVFHGKIAELGTNTSAQFSLIPPNNAAGNFTKVTQRIPVKISIDENPKDFRLLPGMSAVVKVTVK